MIGNAAAEGTALQSTLFRGSQRAGGCPLAVTVDPATGRGVSQMVKVETQALYAFAARDRETAKFPESGQKGSILLRPSQRSTTKDQRRLPGRKIGITILTWW